MLFEISESDGILRIMVNVTDQNGDGDRKS